MNDVYQKPKINYISFYGAIGIVIFIILFLVWAFFSTLETAALAPGKIVVAGNNRVVEHLEGGIISKIFVKNGEIVKKGQVLIKIDDTQAESKFASEHGQLIRLLAEEARLDALINGKNKIAYPDIVMAVSHSLDIKKYLENEEVSFQTELATKVSNLKIYQERVLQLEKQIQGEAAQLEATNQQLVLVKEEVDALLTLAKEDLVDRSRVLAMQREAQQLAGTKGEHHANIAALKQKIGETQLLVIAEQQKLNKAWSTELRTIREKLAESDDREKAAKNIFDRTQMRSPIDGTVINLNVSTVGDVIKPGETLLEIVPLHEELVVEAKINPIDIENVHRGLKAKIMLTALKTRTTPTLFGDVTYVAADAITDERTQHSYFESRIHIDQSELKKLDGKILLPGMPVEVMIITSNQTPWEYFMDPVVRSFKRAFKEQ